MFPDPVLHTAIQSALLICRHVCLRLTSTYLNLTSHFNDFVSRWRKLHVLIARHSPKCIKHQVQNVWKNAEHASFICIRSSGLLWLFRTSLQTLPVVWLPQQGCLLLQLLNIWRPKCHVSGVLILQLHMPVWLGLVRISNSKPTLLTNNRGILQSVKSPFILKPVSHLTVRHHIQYEWKPLSSLPLTQE